MRNLHFVSLATFVLALSATAPSAHATTFGVLYKFLHPSLGYPQSRVELLNGNLYGTGAGDIHYGNGQMFELKNSGGTWSETSADIFNGTDGSTPYGGLIHDSSGQLYGTTSAGDTYGYGNVFYTFNSGGTWYLEKIWAFGGSSGDGQNPGGDLIMDSSGNLYGTTQTGGTYGGGTAFEMSYSGGWIETILHNFGNGSDGRYPYAGLLMDGSGNLYGTTVNGGTHNTTACQYGCGTAFELTQSGGSWKETVLHNFASSKTDGTTPYGALIRNSKTGVLYGTTAYGGANLCNSTYAYYCGTVFKLYLSSGTWKEKVLFNFDGTYGAFPLSRLTWGANTNTLYGTTNNGGADGLVFELSYSGGRWSENVLHNFTGNDGAFPWGAVIRDSSGNLYGTTLYGGDFTNCANGCGTVWEVTP